MNQLTQKQLDLDPKHYPVVNQWLCRGDGIAVYENHALDSSNVGAQQFVSFGSSEDQIETSELPQRLPDIGGRINWPYQLIGVYQGDELE